MIKDADLISIQEIRDLITQAGDAFEILKTFSQERIDGITEAMARAGEAQAQRLAEMAVEETAIGVVKDKVTKNVFASTRVYESIKNERTIGILRRDDRSGIMEIGMPVGIICGIIPTTNPTSTTIFKSIISIKAGNPIIFSPHPRARRSIAAAANVMHEAAISAGAPRGIIGCPKNPTLEGTRELMNHRLTALILATGGSDMVRAAYSSGKPALGVGPGNVPAYIHASADIPQAVQKIVRSKSFDNGTVCSSEQAIVVDRIITDKVRSELKKQGACFLDGKQSKALSTLLIKPGGAMNADFVGKSAAYIARAIGMDTSIEPKVLVAEAGGIGPEYPLSREKLSPVLSFYEVSDWEEGCRFCLKLLALGGIGHSLSLHARDEKVINAFALQKPVSRLLINTPSALGGIGHTTGLTPSLTLGCGTFGGNATTDNISARHLINVKRVAWDLASKGETEPKSTFSQKEAGEISLSDIRQLVQKAVEQVRNNDY